MVILVQFRDQPFGPNHDRDSYNELLFGDVFPNVQDYFREVSQRQSTYRGAGVIGSYLMRDDERTDWDEGILECWHGDQDEPAAGCEGLPTLRTRENLLRRKAIGLVPKVDFGLSLSRSTFDTVSEGTFGRLR